MNILPFIKCLQTERVFPPLSPGGGWTGERGLLSLRDLDVLEREWDSLRSRLESESDSESTDPDSSPSSTSLLLFVCFFESFLELSFLCGEEETFSPSLLLSEEGCELVSSLMTGELPSSPWPCRASTGVALTSETGESLVADGGDDCPPYNTTLERVD